MEIAALVLGIVSLLMSFIPLIGIIAAIPAIVGLVLGIIAIVNKTKEKKPKGMSIAGVILSSLALVIMVWWIIMVGIFASSTFFKEVRTEIRNEFDQSYPYELEDHHLNDEIERYF